MKNEDILYWITAILYIISYLLYNIPYGGEDIYNYSNFRLHIPQSLFDLKHLPITILFSLIDMQLGMTIFIPLFAWRILYPELKAVLGPRRAAFAGASSCILPFILVWSLWSQMLFYPFWLRGLKLMGEGRRCWPWFVVSAVYWPSVPFTITLVNPLFGILSFVLILKFTGLEYTLWGRMAEYGPDLWTVVLCFAYCPLIFRVKSARGLTCCALGLISELGRGMPYAIPFLYWQARNNEGWKYVAYGLFVWYFWLTHVHF